MEVANIGSTYQADHILKDGSIPESALDHVYLSKKIRDIVSVKKLMKSATDLLPVITSMKTDNKLDKSKFKRKVSKRSLKNFTEEAWNSCLSKKDWSKIEECVKIQSKLYAKTLPI